LGAAEPHHQRPGGDGHGQGGDNQGNPSGDQQDPTQGPVAEGTAGEQQLRVNRPGATGTTRTKATGVAAVMTAHQRQRADGSDPVGVNNSTKLSRASAAAPVAG